MILQDTVQPPPKILFLGPEGSYTGEALCESFPHAERLPVASIWEALERLCEDPSVSGAFVPWENLIHGPVAESLDSLIEHREELRIATCVNFPIVHCLGRPPQETGAEHLPITIVASHAQALSQCSKFLKMHFPHARYLPATSTTAALRDLPDSSRTQTAVIASRIALEQAGYEIVAEDIADFPNNQTRFALITHKDVNHANIHCRNELSYRTSLLVVPEKDRQGLLCELLRVVSIDHGLNLSAIHSRPDALGGFVFYLELEGGLHEERVRRCLQALRDFSRDHTGDVVTITSLGSYEAPPFFAPLIRNVGIVGSAGIMGRWFERFLSEQGITTLGADILDADYSTRLATLLEQCEVILLSVPMSGVCELIARMTPLLRPGQLVVENCSIKAVAIPELLRACPQGVEILGIHTMFGGDIQLLRGQNIIITKTERSGPLAKHFIDLLYKHGAQLTYASADQHDRMSAYQQALVQLIALSYGQLLKDAGIDEDSLRCFSTPNSRLLQQIVERVERQPEELTDALQRQNPFAQDIRQQFIAICTNLMKRFQAKKS